MQSRESDIPAPVLTGILAAGYGGVLIACMILERLGVPEGIIQWFALAGAFVPFLLLGLLSGTMNAAAFAGRSLTGGNLFHASAMAAAALTSGLMFLASWLAVSEGVTGIVLFGGLAAGIALHALPLRGQAASAEPASAAWQLSRQTGSRRVRWLAAGLLALLASGVLLAQIRGLRMLLDILFPATAPLPWLAVAGLALAGAWTGGFISATRSLAFTFAIVLTGIGAPIVVLLHAAGDLTWAELFAGRPEIAATPLTAAVEPVVLSTWEWGATPAAGWSGGLALFACMVMAGFLFAALFPAAFRPRQAAGRTSSLVPLLAALLFLAVIVAVGMNARLAGMIASGSLTDVTAGQVATDAGWLFRDGMSGLSGLVEICGMPATSPAIVQAACGAADHLLTQDDIRLNPASAFLLPAAAFGMPAAMWPAILLAVALTAAGTASAMLAAIGGLLAEGAAVNRPGGPPRPASWRLALARAGMLAIAVAMAWLPESGRMNLFELALWPGSMAAAGLAVPLLLVRWQAVMRAKPVIAGMIAGAAVPASLLLARILVAAQAFPPGQESFAGSLAEVPVTVAVLFGAGLNLLILMLGSITGQDTIKDAGRKRDDERGLPGSAGT